MVYGGVACSGNFLLEIFSQKCMITNIKKGCFAEQLQAITLHSYLTASYLQMLNFSNVVILMQLGIFVLYCSIKYILMLDCNSCVLGL